jgi:Uncharacterized protein conserved in bacteria
VERRTLSLPGWKTFFSGFDWRSFYRSKTAVICLAVILAFILAAAAYSIANKTVVLQVDGKASQVKTLCGTVDDLIKAQKVTLKKGDEVIPPLEAKLKENMKVVVNHALHATLIADGKTSKFISCRSTVGDALKEQGVNLSGKDIVYPSTDQRLKEGTKIRVVRVSVKEMAEEATIYPGVVRETDPNLASGLMRVVKAGKNGIEKRIWQVTYHDGQEFGRLLASSSVSRSAVDRVVAVGTATQVSRSGMNIRFKRALDVVASAYTYTGHNTSSGTPPGFGTVAVDPGVIPLGSKLYIEGYGYATALDRGGSIVGNRVDVFMNSYSQARLWGIRRVRVYVL